MELNTTLLRERFVIRGRADPVTLSGGEVIEAMSNRLVVPLMNGAGDILETLIVRSRVMHSAVRLAAQIVATFERLGPLMSRDRSFDFADAWERVHSPHDRRYFDDPWVCVYFKGKPVFATGKYHAFLDVIEKCDLKNPGGYDAAVRIAEETFLKMGRHVSIAHNSNIGMVAHIKDETGRCGLVLRNPHKSTTFNFIASQKDQEFRVSTVQCLNQCAAFLEGIQLAVRVGMNNEKIRQRIVSGISSPEVKENISALGRLEQLSLELDGMDRILDVRYRPERPDFSEIIREAEAFQRQMILSQG